MVHGDRHAEVLTWMNDIFINPVTKKAITPFVTNGPFNALMKDMFRFDLRLPAHSIEQLIDKDETKIDEYINNFPDDEYADKCYEFVGKSFRDTMRNADSFLRTKDERNVLRQTIQISNVDHTFGDIYAVMITSRVDRTNTLKLKIGDRSVSTTLIPVDNDSYVRRISQALLPEMYVAYMYTTEIDDVPISRLYIPDALMNLPASPQFNQRYTSTAFPSPPNRGQPSRPQPSRPTQSRQDQQVNAFEERQQQEQQQRQQIQVQQQRQQQQPQQQQTRQQQQTQLDNQRRTQMQQRNVAQTTEDDMQGQRDIRVKQRKVTHVCDAHWLHQH